MIIRGFFKCSCGKLHTFGGITRTSRCPECSRDLWSLAVTGGQSLSPREFHNRLNTTTHA